MFMHMALDRHRPCDPPVLTVLASWTLTLPPSPLGSPSAPASRPLSLHLIVDVEVPLVFVLHDHTGFL